MTVAIPETEPQSFVIGDTVKWTKDLPDYLPADSWVLSYALVLTGGQKTITATDNSDGTHLATITAANSAGYTAGIYHWQAYVTKATERYMVDSGTIEALPNFATATTGFDNRSHVKTVLDAIEAVLESRATKDQQSYTIQGRTLARTPIPELIALRKQYRNEYQQEVNKERTKNGKASNQVIKVRL